MDAERKRRYAAVRGLFLTHELNRPPAGSGRFVDVRIHLVQHLAGPLTDGTIESVEYVLGVHFTPPTRLITDPTGGYVLEESIYDSVLVLARVRFKDGAEPLLLEHYVHLAEGTSSASAAPGS
jgi:hypothetical protein